MQHGGEILELHQAYIYDNYDFVFDKFINYFNQFRDRGNIYKIFGKLTINSLYGKLGSGIKKTRYCIARNEIEREDIEKNHKIIKIIELNKIYIIEVEDKVKTNGINVGLASIIASKARIKLFRAIYQIEKNGGRILYCDTDSLFIEFKNQIDYSLSK
jgi:DNA polymerase elongation subunit (family B)